MKKIIFYSFITIFNCVFSQQTTITKFPDNLQFYARDVNTNSAYVAIEGTVQQTSGYSSVTLQVLKNGMQISLTTQILTYNLGVSNFTFNPNISAELAQYAFILTSNTGAILRQALDVVVGDVYIVQGQSNAKGYYPFIFPYSNQFIRTFNANEGWTFNPHEDGFTGSSATINNFGSIGYWLAYNIVNAHNIPVLIFNGAEGGKPIGYANKKYSLS